MWIRLRLQWWVARSRGTHWQCKAIHIGNCNVFLYFNNEEITETNVSIASSTVRQMCQMVVLLQMLPIDCLYIKTQHAICCNAQCQVRNLLYCILQLFFYFIFCAVCSDWLAKWAGLLCQLSFIAMLKLFSSWFYFWFQSRAFPFSDNEHIL